MERRGARPRGVIKLNYVACEGSLPMAEVAYRLDRVAEARRQALREYCDLVRQLGGVNAQSLTLFGAVAAGSFDAARHTVRNVLVTGAIDLEFLRRLSEHGAKLGKQRIAAPLIMTPTYIAGSLDTFPLELMEIHQNHVTVFGDDPFTNLTFADGHVRLQ